MITAEQAGAARLGEDSAREEAVIRVRKLVKRYGGGKGQAVVEAVRGIDLDVHQGQIFGLMGPDGAGKTSTFQILAGVMEASGGSAEVFGRPAREARSQTGYLTQAFSLYADLTVAENIRYIGDLRRVAPRDIEERERRYLQMFDMDRFRARLAGRLSGGMKQKLALACALVPQPRVLLLDEPTTGVDPVSRREFWDTLAHLAAGGLTILVATPYLDEAERCHRVSLMHLGEIHATGTPAELRAGLGAQRLEVRCARLGEAEALALSLRGRGGPVMDVQRFGDRLDVLTPDAAEGERALRDAAARARLPIADMRMDTPTLENVFVTTLRRLGQQPAPAPFPARHDHGALSRQTAIGATNLTKRFGPFTAVNNVHLEIRYGEVYGLLGANGAGKTTTIKMLCGLLEPTQWHVQLAGERGRVRSERVRQRIGYMSQRFSLYNDL